ncbi:uncharacterized protein LOC119415115 [Nematolebias whitei]|uniref:uncharacterized protein LOC119415115 n=1 Tax=Nematolebias whitei TaxID=451745 RepID=UPI00189C1E2D|nr:uncharacterized protein LOC119415115 [Nematolebias whitei]
MMTVEEWTARTPSEKGYVVVGVKEHKTTAQMAMFALDQEEEMWFDIYYTIIRPQILRTSACDMDKGSFFLSSIGTSIYNPSNDINRLHLKYNLKPVCNLEARRVYETSVKIKTDAEKALVADYLRQSNATAERRYRMSIPKNIVQARLILNSAAGDSRSKSKRRSRCDEASLSTSCNMQINVLMAFDKLLETHPVSVNEEVPSKEVRVAISQQYQRILYERWIKAQMKLRINHVLKHFRHFSCLPSESRIKAWIKSMGWKNNIPTASSVIMDWKSSRNGKDAINSDLTKKSIKS